MILMVILKYSGELTIKGITHPINFSITLNSGNNASAMLILTDQNTMLDFDLDLSLMS